MEDLKLISPSDLLKKTWKNYQKNVRIYFSILIIPIVFFLVFGLLNIFAFSLISSNEKVDLIFSIIVFISTIVVYIWSWATLYFVIGKKNSDKTIKEYYLDSKKIIIPYLFLLIILSLIFSLGFILLIIPAIIFAVWFCFSFFILIYEKEGIFESISKSKEYTKGLFWPILGRILFVFFILFLVGTLISFLFDILIYGESLVVLKENLSKIVADVLIPPFFISYLYYLYKNVKKVKDK